MKLKLYLRRDYGMCRYYPMNPLSVALAKFKNCKTLTEAQIRQLQSAGFDVEMVAEKLEV